MAKEWILNNAVNRFQLNFKRNVGATSESIRNCVPRNIEDWERYYFENVRSKAHLEELGKKLYSKIHEVLVDEINDITEKDCIDYMFNLVINRTYDGYVREINTIYGELEKILNIKIAPAPDEWDRIYNVDYFIEINNKFIGIQIKPIQVESNITEIFKEENIQRESHKEFYKKYGGKVFYIYSAKSPDENGKVIQNIEVIDDIKNEINRLRNEKY